MGKPMEIAVTDILEVGQLVKSRVMEDGDKDSGPHGVDQIGIIIEIENVTVSGNTGTAEVLRRVVKILWQYGGKVENMPDWIAAEVLTLLPS